MMPPPHPPPAPPLHHTPHQVNTSVAIPHMSQYCDKITKSASPGSIFDNLHTHRPTCTRTATSIFQQYATVRNSAPPQPHEFPTLEHTTNQLRICGVFDDNTTHHISTAQSPGQLVDSGANINITNDIDLLTDVRIITPFNISVAINNTHSTSGHCTHRGLLQLTLNDGNTLSTIQADRGFATLRLCSEEDAISTNRII